MLKHWNKKIYFTILFLFLDILVISIFLRYDILNETTEFRLNPEWSICGNTPNTQTYLFITFVIIAPHLFDQRNKIRNTWANKQFYMQMT